MNAYYNFFVKMGEKKIRKRHFYLVRKTMNLSLTALRIFTIFLKKTSVNITYFVCILLNVVIIACAVFTGRSGLNKFCYQESWHFFQPYLPPLFKTPG